MAGIFKYTSRPFRVVYERIPVNRVQTQEIGLDLLALLDKKVSSIPSEGSSVSTPGDQPEAVKNRLGAALRHSMMIAAEDIAREMGYFHLDEQIINSILDDTSLQTLIDTEYPDSEEVKKLLTFLLETKMSKEEPQHLDLFLCGTCGHVRRDENGGTCPHCGKETITRVP